MNEKQEKYHLYVLEEMIRITDYFEVFIPEDEREEDWREVDANVKLPWETGIDDTDWLIIEEKDYKKCKRYLSEKHGLNEDEHYRIMKKYFEFLETDCGVLISTKITTKLNLYKDEEGDIEF
jgi:hypothetical protein